MNNNWLGSSTFKHENFVIITGGRGHFATHRAMPCETRTQLG
jgi:hypothetical protein